MIHLWAHRNESYQMNCNSHRTHTHRADSANITLIRRQRIVQLNQLMITIMSFDYTKNFHSLEKPLESFTLFETNERGKNRTKPSITIIKLLITIVIAVAVAGGCGAADAVIAILSSAYSVSELWKSFKLNYSKSLC